jgi:glyoxylase-like metal-dependent hydrolase (beta-lactamase superfamily II)
MCQRNDSHTHAHPRNHVTHTTQTSRRDFLRLLTGTTLAGASVLELAVHRAAWASAAAPTGANLFTIHKAAEGVYFAQAHPRAVINCNAAIFVRSQDVVVVDSHSLPSSAAALLAQIKREVTPKPVRYLINTHFHADHTQGNHAYRVTGHKVDIISTTPTKKLLEDLALTRLKDSIDAVPQQIEELTKRSEASSSPAEKAFCADQIRQLREYQSEMKNFTLDLPTITFDDSYLLKDPAFDLHLSFHGRAHTAGDLFVYCPQHSALATGDASHCFLPNIADGYPRLWPATIDEVARIGFNHFLGGHGPMQSNNTVMLNQRNFIEELVEKVEAGKKAGRSLDEMKQLLTVASLKSLQSNNYADFLVRNLTEGIPNFGPRPPLQNDVNDCIRDVYNNLDRT